MNIIGIPNKILKEDNGDNATVYLYGVIGQRDWWGDGEEDITQTAFLKVMKDFEKAGKKRCDVRINSVGGSPFHMDGMIAVMQSSTMEVHTWCDGLAASAAADIFLAAKKERRHIAKNGKLMIHGPSTITFGTAKAHIAAAQMLEVIEAGAIAQMAMDTGMDEDVVKSKYYDGEDHWLSAKQCAEEGFVDKVEDYEAEKMPKEPEKMTAMQLLQFYQPQQPSKETEEPSWLKKILAAVTPQKVAAEPVSPVKKEEEMNLQNLENSFGKEITEDEVVKFLQGKGFDVSKKAEPAAPAAEADFDEKVKKAMKPLEEKIEALTKLLDATPGSVGPTPAKAAGDPPSGDDAGDDVLKTISESFAKDAEQGKNPFLRG